MERRETSREKHDRVLDELLAATEEREDHWSWVNYYNTQDHRLPPGPGSAIMAVATEIRLEWLARKGLGELSYHVIDNGGLSYRVIDNETGEVIETADSDEMSDWYDDLNEQLEEDRLHLEV